MDLLIQSVDMGWLLRIIRLLVFYRMLENSNFKLSRNFIIATIVIRHILIRSSHHMVFPSDLANADIYDGRTHLLRITARNEVLYLLRCSCQSKYWFSYLRLWSGSNSSIAHSSDLCYTVWRISLEDLNRSKFAQQSICRLEYYWMLVSSVERRDIRLCSPSYDHFPELLLAANRLYIHANIIN